MAEDLLILTTGGTFDKRYPEGQWVTEFTFPPGQESAVTDILKRARMDHADYACEWLFAEDSTKITDAQREQIAARCANATQKRIVVTHGTDTMTQRIDPATGKLSTGPSTAQAIAERGLANTQNKTIVLTGAAQPAVLRDSDTDFNLGLAIGAALSAPPGVYVAMNGLVLPWDQTVKNVDGRFRKL
jgi:L-asparaginase